MSFLHVANVKKKFGQTLVLRGVNFAMKEGDQCVIRGASGSGKSTLLYLIGALDRPSEGDIWIQGKNLSTFSEEELALYRNKTLGLVFQFHYLLTSMKGLENILLPARIGSFPLKETKEWVMHLAKELGVTHCLEKYPYELSGGEQQRLNIIRALSLRPKLLLCDEPTGNLDSQNSRLVSDLILKLAKEIRSTLIVVTHDQEVASHFPREVIMTDGVLMASE